LIAMVAIAELLQGDTGISGDSRDAETFARLNVVRRTPR